MSPETQSALSSGAGYALMIFAVGIVVTVVIVVFVILYPRERSRRERQWRENVEGARLRRVRQNAKREAAIGPNQYRCTGCSKVYDKGRSDAEAMAEALKVFGSAVNANGPPCILCSDCYRQIMGDEPPRIITNIEAPP